jgi:hypothetical protein
MFFFAIWGKKKTETSLGVAADFCPICRKIAPFAIKRVGVAAHLYFIPLHEGEFRGHSQTCLSCGTRLPSDPTRFVRLVKFADLPLERLIDATFPSIRDQLSERLALEERIAADPRGMDEETRCATLLDAFHIASEFFDNRDSDGGLRVLAKALRPLEPSEEEVRAGLNHFRSKGAKIGLKLRTEQVMKTLRHKPSVHDFDY